eukprot:g1393.t1
MRVPAAATWLVNPFFLYFLGLVWVLLLPAVSVVTGELKMRGTYFSENALLPGQALTDASAADVRWAQQLDAQYRALPWLGPGGCRDHRAAPGACSKSADWIRARIAEALLARAGDGPGGAAGAAEAGGEGAGADAEAFTQCFEPLSALRRRFGSGGGRGRGSCEHHNAYGVLRARPGTTGADGREALLLIVHYANVGAAAGSSAGDEGAVAPISSLATGLALLRRLRLSGSRWLSKDVVLLVADDGPLDSTDGLSRGTDAWLRAYNRDAGASAGASGGRAGGGAVEMSAGADADADAEVEALQARAGVLRQALVLVDAGARAGSPLPRAPRAPPAGAEGETEADVALLLAGRDGQLPNLDMVNVISHNMKGALRGSDHDEHKRLYASVLELAPRPDPRAAFDSEAERQVWYSGETAARRWLDARSAEGAVGLGLCSLGAGALDAAAAAAVAAGADTGAASGRGAGACGGATSAAAATDWTGHATAAALAARCRRLALRQRGLRRLAAASLQHKVAEPYFDLADAVSGGATAAARHPRAVARYGRRLGALASFAGELAHPQAAPSSAHAACLRRHIDAVGIAVASTRAPPAVGSGAGASGGGPAAAHSALYGWRVRQAARTLALLRGVEASLRSLSNTEERLHHSYWLYLLASPTQFVDVDEYTGIAALLGVALLLVAVRIVSPTVGRAPPLRPAVALASLAAAVLSGLALMLLGRQLVYWAIASGAGGSGGADAAGAGLLARAAAEAVGAGGETELCAAVWLAAAAAACLGTALVALPALAAHPLFRVAARGAGKTGAAAEADAGGPPVTEGAARWLCLKVVCCSYAALALTALALYHYALALPLAAALVPFFGFTAPVWDGGLGLGDPVRVAQLCVFFPPAAVSWLAPLLAVGDDGVYGWLFSVMARHVEHGAIHFPFMCIVLVPAYILSLRIACSSSK